MIERHASGRGPVNLYYFHSRRNFGDELGPVILDRIFGIESRAASAVKADLVALGSLLDLFLWRGRSVLKYVAYGLSAVYQPLHIFGTGFVQQPFLDTQGWPKADLFFRRLEIHAARGLLSAERLWKASGQTREIAVGDPGILASLLLDGNSGTKRHALGIVPHYVDRDNALLIELSQRTRHSVIIDVADDPISILQTISACDAIVSTAMHGLIAADSLGIPNTWVKVSDKIRGGDYKFLDYYSGYGTRHAPCLDLRRGDHFFPTPQSIAENYPISRDEVAEIQRGLIDAFPHGLAQ